MRYYASEYLTGAYSKTHTCALNGLYDPDVTHAGHQPLGFDQWMAFYARYEVVKSTYKVSIVNASSIPIGIAFYPSLSSSFLSYEETGEQTFSRREIVSAKGGIDKAVLVSSAVPRKFVGRSTESVNYTGSASGNPSIVLYWQQVVESLDGSTAVDAYTETTIDYVVKLYDRNTLSSS
jgi:hypothetical protein